MTNQLIGWKVGLRQACMGNEPGTIGYVYDQYRDFDLPDDLGVCVIFKNGEYCGFSKLEQGIFFDFLNPVQEYADYVFTNVMQLMRDFRLGTWRF